MKYILILSLLTQITKSNTNVNGRYFVLFDEEENRSTFGTKLAIINDLLDDRSGGGEISNSLEFIDGLSGKFSEHSILQIETLPEVKEIIPVKKVKANNIQENAPWGLARISTCGKLGPAPYNYEYNDSYKGEGVKVYVIDTGININHEDFEGRAKFGTVTVEGASYDDINGHGTHCAGVIAGKTFGVAKKAEVIAVKVLDDDGEGSDEAVIAGIQWALKDGTPGCKKIINMSLGGEASKMLDLAIKEASKRGVIVVAAAGNSNVDACNSSPARSEFAITVGSTDKNNFKSKFSNYGSCVNILAPGSNINSTWIGSNQATSVESGSSMAAPHVSGLLAVLFSELDSAQETKAKMLDLALKNQILGFNSKTPNLLLNNGNTKSSTGRKKASERFLR